MRVYVDMVADLLHVGHIRLIQRAQAYGDYLIVGIHSDKTCEGYKRKPVQSMEHRCEIISAIKGVDLVIPNAMLEPDDYYLKNLAVNVIVSCPENKEYHNDINKFGDGEHWIEIVYLDRTPGISTTKTIEKIKNEY